MLLFQPMMPARVRILRLRHLDGLPWVEDRVRPIVTSSDTISRCILAREQTTCSCSSSMRVVGNLRISWRVSLSGRTTVSTYRMHLARVCSYSQAQTREPPILSSCNALYGAKRWTFDAGRIRAVGALLGRMGPLFALPGFSNSVLLFHPHPHPRPSPSPFTNPPSNTIFFSSISHRDYT